MRALVTGGAGFIGSALTARLLAEGAHVVVVDDCSAGSPDRLEGLEGAGGHLELHVLDVRSEDLAPLVAATGPEVVFHLAAQVDVGSSVRDPLHDASVNVVGTLRVLEAVRALEDPARVVLAASGGSLYGPEEDVALPTDETNPWGPASPYGLSKRAAVDYLELYARLHGVEGCALALANVYGPGQDRSGEAAVVTAFVDALATGRDLVVNGDGEQTRDLVYLADVVDAFAAAARAPLRHHLYNVGTGIETSVNLLAGTLLRLAGTTSEVRHGPERPGEVRRSALDASRAAAAFSWRPRVGLEDGLRATLAARLAEG